MCAGTESFVHLSDIHFDKNSGDVYDLDEDLRDQLEKDVLKVCQNFKSISGILVSGDIAYSGTSEQYGKALTWLRKLSGILGCDDSMVWVTPGNHDVNRDTVSVCKPLRDLHLKLRKTPVTSLGDELGETMRDTTYRNFVLAPQDNYIEFAALFGCGIDPERLSWQEEIPLAKDYRLLMRGMTSTLVSDGGDHKDKAKLILGEHQATIPGGPRTIGLSMFHHPLTWLLDREVVEAALNVRAKVQLYGHEHSQQVELIRTQEGEPSAVRIVAGAVHPDRGEDEWFPCYNFLSLGVVESDEKDYLEVTIYPRAYDKNTMAFGPGETHGEFRLVYRLALLPATPPEKDNEMPGKVAAEAVEQLEGGANVPAPIGEPVMATAKRLAYRFLTLRHPQIITLAAGLELLEEGDDVLRDSELFKRIFSRAREQDKVSALASAVEEMHGADD